MASEPAPVGERGLLRDHRTAALQVDSSVAGRARKTRLRLLNYFGNVEIIAFGRLVVVVPCCKRRQVGACVAGRYAVTSRPQGGGVCGEDGMRGYSLIFEGCLYPHQEQR